MYFNVVLQFYMFTMIMAFYALFYIPTRIILLLSMWGCCMCIPTHKTLQIHIES